MRDLESDLQSMRHPGWQFSSIHARQGRKGMLLSLEATQSHFSRILPCFVSRVMKTLAEYLLFAFR